MGTQVTAAEDFARRARRARKCLEIKEDRDISTEELAREVSRELGRESEIHQTTVVRWFKRKKPSVPDHDTIRALARVLGVDPRWLVFGDEPTGDTSDVVADAELTDLGLSGGQTGGSVVDVEESGRAEGE